MTVPLFNESEWTFGALDRVFKAVEEIALGEMGLDVYPNQVEIISTEQMLDAYSALGMPLMYRTGRSANCSPARRRSTSTASRASPTRW